MTRVGITGGIGSGKSVVARILRVMGYSVYDCDKSAAKLMRSDRQVITRLTSLLGDDTYLPDGSLNKAKLSAMLFADSTVRDAVNAIVHPAVIADFLGWCGSRSGEDLLFVESAILIESGLLASVDTSIMVTAAPDVRLARIIARDRIDRQQALARMGSQMDDAAKAALCDHIVSNNPGDRLVPQLLGILKSITGKPVE